MIQKKQDNWVGRIWAGKTKLAEVFWFYGLIATAVLWFVTLKLWFGLAMAGVKGTLFLGLLFLASIVGYQVIVSVGVWRSARKYRGPRGWSIAARSVVVLAALWLVLNLYVLLYGLSIDTNDPARNSSNVAGQINKTPKLPLAGFWKQSCDENFGLAIEPSPTSERYSVSFCGPGGCFKPGTYRADTTLANDPDYRVIDNNTIEISRRDGFARYIRCQ